MARPDPTFTTIVAAAVAAIAVGLLINASSFGRHTGGDTAATTETRQAVVAPRQIWAASAAGRVEPRGGEIRVGAQSAGKINDVVVRLNDRVMQGDLLVKLDDDEPTARLAAAEAEAAVRRRERDVETVARLANDRRNAEDQVSLSERALFQAKADLDRAIVGRRTNAATAEDVAKARTAVATARDKLEADRQAFRKAQASAGMPLPTRLEAALTAARSDLSLAEAAVERTRVRAPADGTVLQLNARVGETVAPSPELVLVAIGDVSRLRVRAEVEERDVSKIRVGQRVVIRSDAHAGRDFDGRVAVIAQSLGGPRLNNRGTRRPTDVDVLEVLIDLDGQPPVLPGMRVDVFFATDATVENPPAVKTN